MRGLAQIIGLVALLSGPAAATPIGDVGAGAALWSQCRSCHQIGADARDAVGPHLNGIFGRKAAAHPGFKYSRPMKKAGDEGLTWTLETLDAYVENPRTLVTGTRMSYRGMKDAGDRANLLAFLRSHSDNPGDLPEAQPSALRTDPDLSPDILAIKGDPAYGQYLAGDCTTCHSAKGADTGIPAITGWPEVEFVAAMHGFKAKLRPNPVMQMMAGRLANEEIAALAAYFATLTD